jgi:hypothetical protein
LQGWCHSHGSRAYVNSFRNNMLCWCFHWSRQWSSFT